MANTQGDTAPAKPKEKPRYRLTEKAYINDRLLDPETMPFEADTGDEEEGPKRKPLIITYEGIPGAHMIPVNDAAKLMCEKHKEQYSRSMNPVDRLSIVGPGADTAKAAY